MNRITEDSEVEEVMKQIGVGEGEALRESSKRQSNLEKFAKFRSRNPNTTLTLSDEFTAFVQADKERGEFIDITVPTRKIPQKKTDLPEDYHDYLIQRAMTVHEVGHILYSSYPALEHFTEQVKKDEEQMEGGHPEEYAKMFQNLVNVAEDGAIEKFLSEDFRVGEELTVMRASLHEEEYMGEEFSVGDDVEYHYPFFFAIMTAMLNLGVYDNGELRKLIDENNEKHSFGRAGQSIEREMFIDECLPEIEDYIQKIQHEGSGEGRVKLCYDLWNYLRDYMERATTPGRMEFQQRMQDMDGNGYSRGVPDNLSEEHGEQGDEPVNVAVTKGDEEEESGGGGFGEERKDDVEELGETDSGGNAEEKAEQGIIEETKQEAGGDWSDEIEQIVNALGAGDGIKEIAVAEGGEVDQSRKMEADRYARRTERLFRRRLQKLYRDKEKRGQRRGRIDSRKMISASRGSTRIFKQTEEGDDKNYSCIIVADRSGSMSGRIQEVELAASAIAKGLEENGVDVSVLDTHNSMTTLSKPFQANVDAFEENLLAGRVGGGTPLRYTVEFARERIEQGAGDFPFMIVITDGRPSNTGAYMNELQKASFPVLGLYLSGSRESVQDQLDIFDKAVVSTPDDDIQHQMISLIKRVVF